jgi:Lrp/AsnC family transcriptional regulator for asnA, asnC and gidA
MVSEVQIDAIDRRILETLTKDVRTNLNEIAKDCKLSSSAILKRTENLKAAGVIVGTELRLKRGALGYSYEVTVGIAAENSRIEQVSKAIRQQPNVIVCTKSIGKYNLMTFVIAKSTSELDNVTQKIKNIPGVKGIGIYIWIGEPYHKFEKSDKQPSRDEKLDEIDVQIIMELIKDARMPFTKIASKLEVSHETVRKRYEKMKENGTIKSCSIIVDWSKIGYQGSVFVFIKQSQDNDKSTTNNALKKIPNIGLIANVMGESDILTLALIKDLRDLAKLIDEIQKIPSIDQVEVCFATFTYFSFVPMPLTPIKCDTLELST